eukprot:3941953-Rhodomonas_salina.4
MGCHESRAQIWFTCRCSSPVRGVRTASLLLAFITFFSSLSWNDARGDGSGPGIHFVGAEVSPPGRSRQFGRLLRACNARSGTDIASGATRMELPNSTMQPTR